MMLKTASYLKNRTAYIQPASVLISDIDLDRLVHAAVPFTASAMFRNPQIIQGRGGRSRDVSANKLSRKLDPYPFVPAEPGKED